jgi:hypothetical protein
VSDLTDLRGLCTSGRPCVCLGCRIAEDLAAYVQHLHDLGLQDPGAYVPDSVKNELGTSAVQPDWPAKVAIGLCEGLVRLAAGVMVRTEALGRIDAGINTELSFAAAVQVAVVKIFGETAEQRDFLRTAVPDDEVRH